MGRLDGIPGFGIDRVADAAGTDADILRLENYDTDIPPHPAALEATRAAIGRDDTNSYLPFSGLDEMKSAVAELIARRGGPHYDPHREIVITDGDGSALLNALFVLTDPGDEVILTDPTYAGMLQRVRLVGATPKLVPLRGDRNGWRLDLEALRSTVSDRTRAVFLMNPAIPSGWVANDEEWGAITAICRERGIPLLYWMLWEAIVYGGRAVVVPSALEGMRDLTVTAGAVSLEQRMIGWRVGWLVSRADLAPALAMVHIYNGVVTSGFGQVGAAAALRIGDDDVHAAVGEWERRHEELVRQCKGMPLVPAHGGWSALFDAEACGIDASELSRRLLEQKVAATPMTDAWGGSVATRHLRLVFSNEPVERLALFGERLRAALA
ncbi:pyridoxal phosphate-dependent aminotransferase [Microbacterium sp. B2969]|uniref:Pyridoxal phosphate-dependent aminotransferase n=1 Tax=Microbacterium alkaliflavum TaxID=3248839 RepID=A0ABW7Q5R9_9MICO